MDVGISTSLAGVSLSHAPRLSYQSFLENSAAGGAFDQVGRPNSRATGTVMIMTTDDNVRQPGNLMTVRVFARADTDYWNEAYPDGINIAAATLTVEDNEPNLQVSKSQVSTGEGGGPDTFTVRLTSAPAAAVAVSIGVTGGDTDEAVVSPASIVFGPVAEPSATPRVYKWDDRRTVTVTGQDDAVDDGGAVYTIGLNSSTSSSGASYNSLSRTVSGVNADDDDAALTVSKTAVSTDEGAGTDTFTVQLATEPTAAVTVTIGPTGDGMDEARASPSSLTFAAAASSGVFKWDDPQTVTVTGEDDSAADGSQDYTITVAAASSGDAVYNSDSDVPDVTVSGTNGDNDALTASLSLGASTINESGAGNSTTVSASLNRAAAAVTTVTVTPKPGAYTVGSPGTITIPTGQTAGRGTVTITAADNDVDAADLMTTVSATSSAGVSGPADAALTITDDDDAALTVSKTSVSTSEDGAPAMPGDPDGRDTFTVRLATEPTAQVTVTITSSRTGEARVSPSSLTFAAAASSGVFKWDDPQTVTVTGVDDANPEASQSYTITVAATSPGSGGDAIYHSNSEVPDVALLGRNADNDLPAVTLSLSATSIAENGGTSVVSASLDRASSGDTTVTVTPKSGVYTARRTGTPPPPPVTPGSGVPSASPPATITIPMGQTAGSGTVTITATDNMTDAPDLATSVSATAQADEGTWMRRTWI